MVIGALSYLGINGHLTFVVAVATIAGVFLSVMLGCGLFAAAFSATRAAMIKASPTPHNICLMKPTIGDRISSEIKGALCEESPTTHRQYANIDESEIR